MGVKHLSLLVLLVCATLSIRRIDGALAPAFFVLGDSTVDTGNQDYITTVINSDYPPYGKDFVPPGPTGRFSNGKLANDFVAEYLQLPYPVNFLDPKAHGSIILTGVNLASSGSGYLDITGQIFGVLNLTRQLENLGAVKAEMIQLTGESATTNVLNNAIYLISTGSNDFINNYNINPVIQHQFNPQQYQQHVLDTVSSNLVALYNIGARKVVLNSLSPLGCVPEQQMLYLSKDGECLDWINEPLISFNVGLKALVSQIRGQYPGYELLYANAYDFFQDSLDNYLSYGYNATTTACCGEGAYKGGPCVNPISDVCPDVDHYIFWDYFHPSQKTYKRLADNCWSGGPDQIFPNNLQSIL